MVIGAPVSNAATAVTYQYAPDGRTVTNTAYTSGLTAGRTHDPLGRLASIASSAGGRVRHGSGYTHNDAHLRATRTMTDGSQWRYGYDEFGQLVSAKKRHSDGITVGGDQHEYTYDPVGNRVTTRNVVGRRTQTATYTAQRRERCRSCRRTRRRGTVGLRGTGAAWEG